MTNLSSRVRMRTLVLCLAAASLMLVGCGGQSSSPAPASGSAAQGQEQRYKLEGKVVSIDKPQQRIVVDHKDIPGFMAAMAMPYPIVDAKYLDSVQPGDQITADVVVKDNAVHLENIVVVSKGEPAKPSGSELRPESGKI